jgi:hypothetical protein
VAAKHHVFFDANIYLRFYKLSDVDVRQLGQLVTWVKSGEVKLYLTEQARDEFARNREEAIAESLTRVREHEPMRAFPPMFRDDPGFPDLREAAKAFEDQRKQMLRDISEAASRNELPADQLIAELLSASMQGPARCW